MCFVDLYTDVKTCIRYSDNSLSPYIQSNVGLKQGYLASPILFSLFIDGLDFFLRQNNVSGFQLHPDLINRIIFDNVCRRCRSTVRHYGWVTKQRRLLADFRDLYHRKVNENKTKMVVFKKRGVILKHEKWYCK